MKPYGFAFSSTSAPPTHSANVSAVHTSITSTRPSNRAPFGITAGPNATSTSSVERW